MDSVTQSYSVLLVSASAKFMDSVLPLLPERSFSPITKAPDVSSARRCLLERSYDLLIINAPLPDEFGTISARARRPAFFFSCAPSSTPT